ncbi:MAG: hypothetical protein ABSD78_07440 [Acidimicrobiales bacterium]|jgi:hypothetical protein
MTWSIRRTTRGVGVAVLGVALALGGATATAAAGTQPKSRPDTRPATRPPVGAVPTATVPEGFKANSITWLSPKQGWVLGTAPCGTKMCSDVIGTTNGAKSWSLVGRVNTPIALSGSKTKKGVTEIRFATAEVGWAFGPDLYRTTNGGRTWASMPIPGQGTQLLDLAANSTNVYALTSPCKWATFCRQASSFWRTATLTGSSWILVMQLPSISFEPFTDIAVYGQTVYVVVPGGGYGGPTEGSVSTGPLQQPPRDGGAPNELFASTDGRHFSSRPVPCSPFPPYALFQAVPTSATDVALLCDGNHTFSGAQKFVYLSANTGRTDTYVGAMDEVGAVAELAVSPSGNLVAAAWGPDSTVIYINDTHETTWTMVINKSDGGLGFNDIVYVTDEEAWVVYAPADAGPAALGQVFVTHDGGQHWSLAAL